MAAPPAAAVPTAPGAGPALAPAVKICGVCTPADAALAAAAGAACVGVILAPGRGRSRSLSEAAAIFEAAGASRRVGVFVDAAAEVVLTAAAALALDVVQLHGDESPELAAALRAELRQQREAEAETEALQPGSRPGDTPQPGRAGQAVRARQTVRVWKAVRVQDARDIAAAAVAYGSAVDGLLLDGWSPRGHGGVGARFDWDAAAPARASVPAGMELVIAGGLTPENVGAAARLLRPDVVDVSSGVEEALCRKSAERVHAFIAAARGGAG
jgi:phosphoribosylanthranilate isomerase